MTRVNRIAPNSVPPDTRSKSPRVPPIEEYLSRCPQTWDAILLLDVLEHFAHDHGAEILAAARRQLSPGGRLYVGTPAVWMEQGAAYGNEFERNRSLWTEEELREAGFSVLEAGNPDRFGNQMLLAVQSVRASAK